MKPHQTIIRLLGVVTLAAFGVLYYLAQMPESDYPVLPKDEHDALYKSTDNGWHQVEEALRVIEVPTDDLRSELSFSRVTSVYSPEGTRYLDGQHDAMDIAMQALSKDYTILPRGPYTSRMSPGQMLSMRALAEAIAWNGVRLELQQQFEDAVQLYLAAIKLGHLTMNGSDLNEAFVGGVFQVIALRELVKVLPSLTEEALQHVVDELLHMENVSIPLEQIVAYDDAMYYELPQQTMLSRIRARFKERHNAERIQASFNFGRTHLLATRLSAQARLYTIEHGEPPSSLEAMLSPEPVPLDPVRGTPFQLEPDGTIDIEPPHQLIPPTGE